MIEAGPMSGKVCLITGATTGIGKAAAFALAGQGATVCLVGRDPERTKGVAAAIMEQTGNQKVEYYLADLSLLAEVRRLAAEFRKRHDTLNVLINNAGAVFTGREVTVDGFERTWALNHLAYFLLTQELLDALKAGAPSRIVNVSSHAHKGARRGLNFEDLQGEKRYSGFSAYAQSKLANILFTQALARRLQGTGVTVNAVHPGTVATGFGKNTPGFLKTVLTVARPFMRTPEKGAETLVYLAASPEVDGKTGLYYFDLKPVPPTAAARDEAAQERLWEVSLRQTTAAA